MFPVPEQVDKDTTGTLDTIVAVDTATTSLADRSRPFRRYGSTITASVGNARGGACLLIRLSVQGIAEGRSEQHKQHKVKAKVIGLEIH